MDDQLLRFYNSELEYLRRAGAEFARAHPQTAELLNFDGRAEYDPHVGRMIQAFAFLNARTRQKLEDDFPEIAGAMMDLLYPHYLRPIPSMAIARMQLEPHQVEFLSGYEVPRHTKLETPSVAGQSCRFRTCYDLRVLPIEVTAASLRGVPFAAPRTPFSQAATALVTLRLNTFSEDVSFSQLELPSLRLFLHAPMYFAQELYELLINNVLGVAVAEKPERAGKVLPGDPLTPVGFAPDEGMIDYPPQSFLGYRLLTEYFAFPEKFMFVDLQFGETLAAHESSQLEVYIYLDQHRDALEPHVSQATFQLGCTPIVNLYPQRAEPLRLTQFHSEYRVVPDARRPHQHEVYSIDRVVGALVDGKDVEFAPFYSTQHATSGLGGGRPAQSPVTGDPVGDHAASGGTARQPIDHFWLGARHPVSAVDPNESGGTEMLMSFVDLDFSPAQPAEPLIVDIETTCLNRNLPAKLPFGGEPLRLTFESGSAVKRVVCLTKPTQTLRPPLRNEMRWRLISHLTLSHLSLAGPDGLAALKEMLELYDFRESSQTRKAIAGLVGIDAKPAVGRVAGSGAGGLCRGVDVELQFDQEQFTEGGLFLMASVLDRFLGLYTTINSFTRTTIRLSQREGVLKQWPPRAGQQVLL